MLNVKNPSLGKGNTGRTIDTAKNLNEVLAMKSVMSGDHATGKILSDIGMDDPRWLAKDGWVKMAKNFKLSDGTKIEIHYNYNTVNNTVDDFKFK